MAIKKTTPAKTKQAVTKTVVTKPKKIEVKKIAPEREKKAMPHVRVQTAEGWKRMMKRLKKEA